MFFNGEGGLFWLSFWFTSPSVQVQFYFSSGSVPGRFSRIEAVVADYVK